MPAPKLLFMGAPKRKAHAAAARAVRRPTKAEREAAEMRADVEAYDRAKAQWEADGRPAPIPWEQVKRELNLK
jgi:hypothetical protein